MANFPSATQARERGQGNRVITEEIMILELAVLDAIANNKLVVEYGGSLSDSSSSTLSINGTVISASPMTADNATGRSYYSVWKETETDLTKTEQMAEVIAHFQNKGYSISRLSSNSTTLYWKISW